jgi:hypothetical protein
MSFPRLPDTWLDARHTIAAHSTPPLVNPRTGLIRRHLHDDSAAPHLASTITGSFTRAPDSKAPTSTNTQNDQRAEDQIWGRQPHNPLIPSPNKSATSGNTEPQVEAVQLPAAAQRGV